MVPKRLNYAPGPDANAQNAQVGVQRYRALMKTVSTGAGGWTRSKKSASEMM